MTDQIWATRFQEISEPILKALCFGRIGERAAEDIPLAIRAAHALNRCRLRHSHDDFGSGFRAYSVSMGEGGYPLFSSTQHSLVR